MKLSKIAALLMLPVLALTLAACSAPKGDAKDATSGDAQIAELVAQKPSSAEEAAELYQQLLQKENEIFASDNALWEKVFNAANKDSAMIEDGSNYGDFLLDTIEGAKDQFTADELKTLKAGAQQVKEIEDKLMALEKEFPGCGSTPGEGESVDASTAGMTNGESGETKFPSFKGKDLDGNDVNSDELFSKNKVTVMNFWFTTCKPCVGELGDLEKLNKELAEKGGQVVGVNSFTLDGNKDEVADAKDVLSKKGVTYKNIWFKSDSEAGKFTSNLYSFPTTYVVDKNGNNVKTYSSDAKDITMPMAVLINSDTAGYGELFACDLKDFGKAFLIGEKTAGRADVQETFELSDGGAVVLTTSKMLPYISESFDGKGLTPDTEIILADSLRENLSTLEKERDTQLQAAISMLAGNSSEG
ncbi:MAG: hypothetical protein EGQ01_03330 [Ruminococcaceae bacterium]|nr:hypothetical protein [Oscillospiraceae bacterium]